MLLRHLLLSLIICTAVHAVAQSQTTTTTTTTASTTKSTGPVEMGYDDRLRPAPAPKKAEPGMVLATDAGGLGGATSFTQDLPLDGPSLIKLRQPFITRPEFRGAWVTRMEWVARPNGKYDKDETRQRIVDILTSGQALNLNAVIFQMRGDTTVLFPSEIEPYSRLLDGQHPGFDTMQFAIDEAHKRGMEFHAYVNPVPASDERTSPPQNKNHIWYKHCMPESEPNWLVHQGGQIAPFEEYWWMNPNLPEVQHYIRTAMMDIVKRYDIDGLHYDRIRFPGPKVSDDKWSKARFEGGANPHNLDYNAWQAENITRMLSDIYVLVQERRPEVKISSSVWGIYDHTKLPQGKDKATGYSWTSSGLQDYHQDSIGWMNHGCMDAIVPMMYWNMGDMKPDFDELLLQFVSSIHTGRHVYAGQRVFSGEEMVRQVVASNRIGGQGTVPFTLRGIARLGDFYPKNIYPNKVPTPDMHWKTKPIYGHAIVTVTGADGKPVVDAHVKVEGQKFIGLSAIDGLCGVLNLPAGEAKVTVEKSGAGKAEKSVKISRGKVARLSIQLQDQ